MGLRNSLHIMRSSPCERVLNTNPSLELLYVLYQLGLRIFVRIHFRRILAYFIKHLATAIDLFVPQCKRTAEQLSIVKSWSYTRQCFRTNVF